MTGGRIFVVLMSSSSSWINIGSKLTRHTTIFVTTNIINKSSGTRTVML
jgi:hypothetical protein